MSISKHQIDTIKAGAEVAKTSELYRLGGLLEATADLLRESVHIPIPIELELILDRQADYATKVANDLLNHEASQAS